MRFCTIPIVLLALICATSFGADAADRGSMSARIDGRNWTASRVTAITFRFGDSPALNITGVLDGPPTSRLSFNLVLEVEDEYGEDFPLRPAAARTSHGNFTFNVMNPDAPENLVTIENGLLSIDRYDAERQTVSGHFSAIATDASRTRRLLITDGVFANIPVLSGR